MNILAMHLPQYHVFPENEQWWGKNFTDWTNVKKAKPLFSGHDQPLVPYNNFYYDMTDINTLKFQEKISREYGIYGFCYYHYWFNGKLLMEKPCELLLKHKEINQKFCFCWANETWSRTWDGKEDDILIKQEYGGIEDWDRHFNYLLDFFKDGRYIKINNSPVIFIYSCSRLQRFNEMVSYWRSKAKANGFSNIFVVEFVNSFNSGKNNNDTDIIVEFEPLCTARYAVSNFVKFKRFINKKMNRMDLLDYDYIWNCLLKNRRKYNKKIWRSAFVNFDNSPRKGKRSLILKNASPEKFGRYLKMLVESKARDYDDNFLVINAWNEWAEGAVLEPSINNGFEYLNKVKNIIE